METLFARNNRLMQLTPTDYLRRMYDEINWNSRLIAIRGSRGVGKTTMMIQHQKLNYGIDNRKALYVKLDAPYFSNHSLWELAEEFYKMGGERLYIDEVHKYEHWSREIKDIYDYIPNLKVTISASSLLQLLNAEADLSRRCVNYNLPVWSYREYLLLFHNIELPPFSLDDILRRSSEICTLVNSKLLPLEHFGDYLRRGCYPYSSQNQEEFEQLLENVVDFTIGVELPLLRGVDVGKFRQIKMLLTIVSNEVPMLVDLSRLAALTSLSRVTLLGYLQHLSDANLLRLLYADEASVKKLQKPDKMLMADTNLLYLLSTSTPNTGTLRETFFCNQLGYKHRVEYSKKGDFLVDGTLTFEVGGAQKDGKQIAGKSNAFIASDGIEYAFGNKLPLWLFGLLY